MCLNSSKPSHRVTCADVVVASQRSKLADIHISCTVARVQVSLASMSSGREKEGEELGIGRAKRHRKALIDNIQCVTKPAL
uniref:Uncharacterized protein n=1 Tax=Angiostrongylus cantonensis TaxID=6313 RepID=A0A0K0DFY5_ANGCA